MNRVLFVLLAALIGSSAEAQVFKCVDANGAITFTNMHCDASQHESTARRARTAQERERDEVEAIHRDSLKVLRAARQPAPPVPAAAPVPPYSGPRVADYDSLAARNARVESTQKSGQVFDPRAGRRQAEGDDSQPSTASDSSKPASPAVISRCNERGCYDNGGNLYRRKGPDKFINSDGSFCKLRGRWLNCN